MPRIRVLHVVLNLNDGGLERILAELVQRSDPSRLDVHVLALEYLGRFSRGLERHARLHVADPLPRWSMLWPRSLARTMREIAPTVVHTHSGVWYKASLAARQAGVPRLVHTDHGRQIPDPWPDRVVDGLASRRTDVVIAVSKTLAQQLATTVVSHPSRIRVIANGIDTDRFQPVADDGGLRRELGVAPDVPILGSIGRLDPIKGFDVMIEAFAHLLSRWSGPARPVLVIAGEGPEQARLLSLSSRPELEGRVRFLGWRDDVRELHSGLTLYTMASRSEGTSLGLLEAMAAGLCPVVTDVGGNPAVLGGDLSHRLCPAEDADALADAWMHALTDPARMRADGRTARRRVEESFSVQEMVRAHEELYLEMGQWSGN